MTPSTIDFSLELPTQNPLSPLFGQTSWIHKLIQLPSSCFMLQVQFTVTTLDSKDTQNLSFPAPLQVDVCQNFNEQTYRPR